MWMSDADHRDHLNGRISRETISVQRENDPTGQNRPKWARGMFGKMIADVQSIFIPPGEEDAKIG